MKCCRQEYIKKVELDLQNFGEFSTEIRIRISNLEVKRLEDICKSVVQHVYIECLSINITTTSSPGAGKSCKLEGV